MNVLDYKADAAQFAREAKEQGAVHVAVLIPAVEQEQYGVEGMDRLGPHMVRYHGWDVLWAPIHAIAVDELGNAWCLMDNGARIQFLYGEQIGYAEREQEPAPAVCQCEGPQACGLCWVNPGPLVFKGHAPDGLAVYGEQA